MDTHSALLTDLYQLTMAYGYWQLGMAEQEATFHLFYRKNPFQGNYAISSGLEPVIEFLNNYQFSNEELNYLENLKTSKGTFLFSKDFLNYLSELKFCCDLWAIPEGEIVFPYEPLLRVQGPILQCQLIETPLVNLINYSSLIATKASRICQAAEGGPVVEFGLRRAHGPNGAMLAIRSAFIGGCESTSNTLAGMKYGIPVRGTMAHSWIMAFNDEITAFEKFCEVMPQNIILLVDTYDTIQGIKNAIKVGKKLLENHTNLLGIRLDSGDLNQLSKASRVLLDEAGFQNTKIMASGDLDEYSITELKKQNAPIDTWGVGTRLMTAYDQPSLDAAYKLSAIKSKNGVWEYKIKLSNTPAKTTNPGIQQVRRHYQQQKWLGDIIYDVEFGISENPSSYITNSDRVKDLLVPIITKGKLTYQIPTLEKSREFCLNNIKDFIPQTIEKFSVALEPKLQAEKDRLTREIKLKYS